MFISLAGSTEVVIRAPAPKRCGSAHLIDSYVWECLESDTQRTFELHLMECSTCLRSVELERLVAKNPEHHEHDAREPQQHEHGQHVGVAEPRLFERRAVASVGHGTTVRRA